MENNDTYWVQFGKEIAAPTVYSFCLWIKEMICFDNRFSDIIFVARDGYLPYVYFKKYQRTTTNVNFHYVYAPRTIAMANSEGDYLEFEKYLKSQKFGNKAIAIVDSITMRFSAQKLIGRYLKNKLVGLYWRVLSSAKEIAYAEGLEYFTFQGEHIEVVPCWALMEFIFSAPERPVKSIKNNQVEYYRGNSFEDRRLSIFSDIMIGVSQFFNSTKLDLFISYSDIVNRLLDFYCNPTITDIYFFDSVYVSDYPDHSDNLKIQFFRPTEKRSLYILVVNRISIRVRAFKNKLCRQKDILLKAFFTCTYSPKHLERIISAYDVVSFDIFDTLIFRNCNQPRDVFLRLEEHNGLFDFAKIRISAESKAREEHPEINGEINIYDIYSVLKHYYGERISDSFVSDEVNAEIAVCYANPYMKEVYNYCRQKGISIIAVSDMYLPAELISKILQSCGYEIDSIFISCELHETKESGRLQREVWRIIGTDKRVVHLGDNYYSDYLRSKQCGWKAFYFPHK